MADEPQHPRRNLLRGPSKGVLAWTAYWIGIIDWLIDARKRWYQGGAGPGRRSRLSHLAVASVPGAIVLATFAVRTL